ncbi:tryptophan 2,3-dioxygenase [Streptomyces sp. S3(2020)]|uniref:tryptophan 2,3-dioxygenase n=1 Tax=Streptomyces sp. S3(2020) TaxID=2732044 RepID=UPI001487B28B|nr:tryptophan 2,3-dioxygenase family protein [Streptomyces sp. S3(2020)]NNN30751.1 tryptophan 2,3-dioxygenase [Streptomyces sp. S3(2020)]
MTSAQQAVPESPEPPAGCPVTGGGPSRVGTLSEEQRRERAVATGGRPILDFDGERSPYVAYGEIDVLLSLQKPPSGTHDEMLFLMSGQLMELMFKLMTHELTEAKRRIADDEIPAALLTFQRVTRVQELLVKGWDVVSTLSPAQFLGFRDHLGEASGFQSAGYRHLELLLGNKQPGMLGPHRGSPHTHTALSAALAAPSLYDETIALLHRRGHPVAAEHLDRDLTRPYEPHSTVEQAWLEVYADQSPGNDLFLLGEALINLADLYRQWRYRHLIAVERVMGCKPGTGGTSGVEWLRRICEHLFFPELWSVRTQL